MQSSPKRVSVPVLINKDGSKVDNGSALVSSSQNNGVGNGGDNSCSTTLGTQPSPSSVGCRDDDCTPSPGPTSSGLMTGNPHHTHHHAHHHLAAHLSQSQVASGLHHHHAAAEHHAGVHPSTSAMYLTSQALGSLGFHRQALMENPPSSLHPYHHHHHHHQHHQMQHQAQQQQNSLSAYLPLHNARW